MEIKIRNLAGIFKALSDETRLTMLAMLLKRDELCVCDFVDAMGITQSKASRHLRYLRSAGLLHDRREAVWVHYSIAEDAEGEPGAVLENLAPLLGRHSLGDLDSRLDKWINRKKRSGGACPAPRRPMRGRRRRKPDIERRNRHG